MHVKCGVPLPLQIGDPKPPFSRFCNLTANLVAYIFGTKHDTNIWAIALQTARGFVYRLERT